MVRRGDPMVVKVMGTRIGLAAELARGVTVEVGVETCEPGDDAADPTHQPGAKS